MKRFRTAPLLPQYGPAAALLGGGVALTLSATGFFGSQATPSSTTLNTLLVALGLAGVALSARSGQQLGHCRHESHAAADHAREADERSRTLARLTEAATWECDGSYHITSLVAPDTLPTSISLPAPDSDLRNWAPLLRHMGVSAPARDAVHSCEAFAAVVDVTSADGVRRSAEIRALPKISADGRFAGYRGVIRLRGHEEPDGARLDEERERLKAYLALGEGFYWEQDASLRFVSFLHSARRPGRELTRRALGRRLDELDLAHGRTHVQIITRGQEAGKAFADLTISLRDDTGKWHWFTLNGDAVADDQGRLTGFRGQGRDITDQIMSERALVRSEERYQQLARVSPDAILVLRDGVILYANPAALELLGQTDAARVISQQLLDYVDPASRDGLIEQMVALQTGRDRETPPRIELRLNPANRPPVTVEATNALFEADGRPAVLSMFRDVSAARRIEGELRESHERYRLLFDLSPDPVFVTRGGVFLIANSKTATVFGADTPEDLVGTSLARFLHPDRRAPEMARLARLEQSSEPRAPPVTTPSSAAASREPLGSAATQTRFAPELHRLEADTAPVAMETAEQTCITADGRTLMLEFHSVRMHINNRPAVLSSVRDVTGRKRMEAELRALNETLETRVRERTAEVEAYNRELEAFSYSVSHDLRAPLRGIDGFSQILVEDYSTVLDAEGRQYLSRIRNATQRMAALIDDLLDLGRVARAPLFRRSVDVSALAGEILAELVESDPARSAQIQVADGMTVEADPQLLRIVLDNLLRNAWKFSRLKPITTIEVGSVSADGMSGVYIADNGTGFDMAHADKLFRPFERLHAADEFEGTGIGLATVKRVVERHGGTVIAHGEPGRGARFEVLFP